MSECTYDQPSTRRRNPDSQYVEALEARLHRLENVLRSVAPDIEIDAIEGLARPAGDDAAAKPGGQAEKGLSEEQDPMLESMVESTGMLSLDDQGYYIFHGHSSGNAFLSRMRQQFGELVSQTEIYGASPLHPRASGLSNDPEKIQPQAPNTLSLPPKSCAEQLSASALDDSLVVLRFIHQPSYYALLDRVYDLPFEELSSEDIKSLPLIYAVIALGTLHATGERSELMTNGFKNAIEQGNHFYRVSHSMMDVTECRDIESVQAMFCTIMFLLASAKTYTCYSHLGIVLRACVRLGLHRSIPNQFDPIEQEVRKRVFWSIRKVDMYVSMLLGLPNMMSEDDTDQEEPLDVDDEFITTTEVLTPSVQWPSMMAAFNSHTRIVKILCKTIHYIYPIKPHVVKPDHCYIVSHAKIREIEHDLREWEAALPAEFKVGAAAPSRFVRVQHLLRMAYAHIELSLYRPFLHYASQRCQGSPVNKRSYACAAACVSVSRNIVHLLEEMKRRNLLNGSYWFYNYTAFFAVMSLVFFVLENPHSSTSAAILADARRGKTVLSELSNKSLAAHQCSRRLQDLFEHLPAQLHTAMRKHTIRKQQHGTDGAISAKDPPFISFLKPDSADPEISPTILPGKSHKIKSEYMEPSLNPGVQSASLASHDPSASSRVLHEETVPELSAMMFPSSDPFAYPNQPMLTLEELQQQQASVPMVLGPSKMRGVSAAHFAIDEMPPEMLMDDIMAQTYSEIGGYPAWVPPEPGSAYLPVVTQTRPGAFDQYWPPQQPSETMPPADSSVLFPNQDAVSGKKWWPPPG